MSSAAAELKILGYVNLTVVVCWMRKTVWFLGRGILWEWERESGHWFARE